MAGMGRLSMLQLNNTMSPLRAILWRVAGVFCISVLSACQAVKPPAAQAPAPKTPFAPLATHTFTFDPERDSVVGELQVTQAGADDTLSDIARRFNIGYEEIVRANPEVDPWLPKAGTTIVLPTQFVLPDGPRSGIVINLAALRLYYFPPRKKHELQTVITHPIGIGMVGWTTPLGSTKVTGKRANPVWNPPASVRKEHLADGDPLPKAVPPGPDNPLGKYALSLAWPSYLIHGTNQPYGVGIRASHGCIRMYPEDIALLYDDIPVGTSVTVVNQPILYGHRGDSIYLQTFPVYDDYPKPKAVAHIGSINKTKSKADIKATVTKDMAVSAALSQQGEAQQATAPVKGGEKSAKKGTTKAVATATQKSVVPAVAPRNTALIAELSQHPRGITVPISQPALTLDNYLAAVRLVENRLPEQATWDGVD
ncbi:MAG TPA: L,D-transpeptidase family protein [Spongiibacteraceae bacterium]|nr:L,D-transpeptidase family protein [Spongiibacteraceae bacterium]